MLKGLRDSIQVRDAKIRKIRNSAYRQAIREKNADNQEDLLKFKEKLQKKEEEIAELRLTYERELKAKDADHKRALQRKDQEVVDKVEELQSQLDKSRERDRQLNILEEFLVQNIADADVALATFDSTVSFLRQQAGVASGVSDRLNKLKKRIRDFQEEYAKNPPSSKKVTALSKKFLS